MRGAKPSSGLVHLHKSFVELHFSGRPLPQNVSIVPCVDGNKLGTVLPGQVYATSCGQDHWLLGLQFIFKAYKEPVITLVEKTGDNQVTVAIATQGLHDKYTSDDPLQCAELQRSMEAAALKFAQAAVMRKAGRLQINGPNINIPKKQLRAQWPAVLERVAPQEVTAHIFVDSTDVYIACAAKIILTKAKAEPVFYLSGLSQLLKSFTGSYVTVDLMPNEQVVRLNIDTGKSRPASMSTTAAAAAGTTLRADQAEASSAAAQQPDATASAAEAGELRHECNRTSSSQSEAAGSRECAPPTVATVAGPQKLSLSECAGAAQDVDSRAMSSPVSAVHQASSDQPPIDVATAKTDAAEQWTACAAHSRPSEQQQQHMVEGMASSYIGLCSDGAAAAVAPQKVQPATVLADNSDCTNSFRPALARPGACSGQAASPKTRDVEVAAAADPALLSPALTARPASTTLHAAAGSVEGMAVASAAAWASGGAVCAGITAGSDAGLRLLADHAAQLQKVGSTGNLASAAVTTRPAAQTQKQQHSSGGRRDWQARGGKRYSAGIGATPCSAATAAGSSNLAGADTMLFDAAAAAAVPVHPAALVSAVMAAAVAPAASECIRTRDTGMHGSHGVAAGLARLASDDRELLARQGSAQFTAAAAGTSSQPGLAAVHLATAATATGSEVDCPHVEGWQMHPKRRRTAHAMDVRHKMCSQDYWSAVPGPVQAADMGHDMLYDSSAAAAGHFDFWDAAAMATRVTGAVTQQMCQPDLYLLPHPQQQQQQEYVYLQQHCLQQHCQQQQQHHQQQEQEQLRMLRHNSSNWLSPFSARQQQQEERQMTSTAYRLPALAATALPASGADVFNGCSSDVEALAQQHEDQHGSDGAVAVVVCVGSGVNSLADKRQQQQKLEGMHSVAELPAAVAAHQQQQLYTHGAAAYWHPAALPVETVASIRAEETADTAALRSPIAAVALGAAAAAAPSSTGKAGVGAQALGSGTVGSPSDWSPAVQHLSSPVSNTSTISRLPGGRGSVPDSTPGNCSPAVIATNGACAAATAGANSMSSGYGFTGAGGGAFVGGLGAQCASRPGQMADEQPAGHADVAATAAAEAATTLQGLRPPVSSTPMRSGSFPKPEAQPGVQRSSTSMRCEYRTDADRQPGTALPATTTAAAAAGVAGAAGPMHQQQQQQMQMQPVGDNQCAAESADGWPILPDADNLLVVGKALVQVMNLLGAGSEARLVLTRALRSMSPHDREWLLSITYPHLQDSCRRKALAEMRMILNEVAGMDCFAGAGAGAQAAAGSAAGAAGVAMAARVVDAGHTY